MTKSYIIAEINIENYYKSWERNIIAPRFTIKNFADELHYYLRIYLFEKKPIRKIIIFLFFNAIQRILYTYGTFSIKIRKHNQPQSTK